MTVVSFSLSLWKAHSNSPSLYAVCLLCDLDSKQNGKPLGYKSNKTFAFIYGEGGSEVCASGFWPEDGGRHLEPGFCGAGRGRRAGGTIERPALPWSARAEPCCPAGLGRLGSLQQKKVLGTGLKAGCGAGDRPASPAARSEHRSLAGRRRLRWTTSAFSHSLF